MATALELATDRAFTLRFRHRNQANPATSFHYYEQAGSMLVMMSFLQAGELVKHQATVDLSAEALSWTEASETFTALAADGSQLTRIDISLYIIARMRSEPDCTGRCRWLTSSGTSS